MLSPALHKLRLPACPSPTAVRHSLRTGDRYVQPTVLVRASALTPPVWAFRFFGGVPPALSLFAQHNTVLSCLSCLVWWSFGRRVAGFCDYV